jgi:DNA-directed RNA polymerase specialized sigma subunit
MDLIQEGSKGLTQAVDKIIWDVVTGSDDKEKTLKSFLSKRIKGAIRRGVDINRGTMRIPEHKINEMRKDTSGDKKAVEAFFNSVFTSLDELIENSDGAYEIPDDSPDWNNGILNAYLLNLLKVNLNLKEYDVLRMSYGLDCDKKSAKEIAIHIGINGNSAYVRVSQLKRQAIDKLIDNVDHSQVIDFM